MSFNSEIRTVRDERLPISRRFVALRSAVTMFSPNGFNATFTNLASQVEAADLTGRWTEKQLVKAADLLTQSRNHYLSHSNEWHATRRENKQNGARSISETELAARNSPPWFDSVSTGTRRRFPWVTLSEGAARFKEPASPLGTELGDDYQIVRDIMASGRQDSQRSYLAHYGPFQTHLVPANVIAIPYRVYAEPLLDSAYNSLSTTQRSIADCLYSRSDNGYIRQRHLTRIVKLEELWVIPYVVAALGDYVVEVVEEVSAIVPELSQGSSWKARKYRLFAKHNPDLLQLVGQQAASYWDCYYSHEFTITPRSTSKPRYPAMAVLDLLDTKYQQRYFTMT